MNEIMCLNLENLIYYTQVTVPKYYLKIKAIVIGQFNHDFEYKTINLSRVF